MARLQKFPTLSIIIPTLNEANHLPLLLADLNAWPYNFDITIVDGGSSDSTISIAQIQGVNTINGLKQNRGFQLKTGASNAKGDWLLFLHADSRLDQSMGRKGLLKIMQTKTSKTLHGILTLKSKNII